MVIVKILTPSEDIQTEILNKTTNQLKKKKSTGENRFVGYSFLLLPYIIWLRGTRPKRNKERLD